TPMSQRFARRRSSTQRRDDDEEDNDTMDDRIKEATQCVLAAHEGKGGLKDAEVKKALKDAVQITEKQMKDVLGCKLVKDGERLFFSYVKKMPLAAQPQSDPIMEAKHGLLSVVLMFIHMTKNPLVKADKVKDFALWEFLELLEVLPNTSHPVFGLPSKLIAPSNAAVFVAQGWLSFEKRQGDRGDAEEIFYDWGPRAVGIVHPQEILEAFCEVSGEKAEDWKEHFKLGRKKDEDKDKPPVTRRESSRIKRHS
ncbi:hypothetical protein PMAYCL1PPCAC_18988, partial [Pristionchus mayeri]